jgi:hypothetical protein
LKASSELCIATVARGIREEWALFPALKFHKLLQR